jgi:hypothetical protein
MPDKNGAKTVARDERGRFVAGNAGGPGRPPAEFSITAILRARVQERPKLLERLLQLAESQDENVSLKAIVAIMNRIDGMPKQPAELSGKDGAPMSVEIVRGGPELGV